MLCRNCNKILPADVAFCPHCGTRQDSGKICPECGTPLPEGSVYCLGCGSRIDINHGDNSVRVIRAKRRGESFYKSWIAEHRQLAETKHITWISEFCGNYAVALDDNAPGRELRPFLVRGVDTAEVICYMSWTGANVANGVLDSVGDCFRNGARFLSFILFMSNSMLSPGEYKRILQSFTGLSEPLATSGLALLIARDGHIVFGSQYQENITGIADVFPIRMIGPEYALYISPEDYNKMTNRQRYNASSDLMRTAPQMIVDLENGNSVISKVFVPKYDGDPSGSFVEFFDYSDDLINSVLRNTEEKDARRCIFNRATGTVYRSAAGVRYKPLRISGSDKRIQYLLLKIADIRPIKGRSGDTKSGRYDLISGSDESVINLGRYDLQYLPELVGAGGRIYISTHAPEGTDNDGNVNCANNVTNMYCFEPTESGKYTRIAAGGLKTGGGFTDGIVRIHLADGKTEPCYGAFTLGGKTYISLIKEKDERTEQYDKCVLLDDSLKAICWFNFKSHYGSQAPYGIHIFNDTIYSLSGEDNEYGTENAVLRNISTGETIFSVLASTLISHAGTEFGTSRISPRYEFGSYRIGGEPYFLVGKQNKALGIMDLHGKTIIPTDRDNYFIVSGGALGIIGEGQSYVRLPQDTFLIVLGGFDNDRYRVCGADGKNIFEGSMKELIAKFG